jgi:hypothetical protein
VMTIRMVRLTDGRVKKGEFVSNELVGLSEPTPYIYALFAYTAKADAEKKRMEKEKAHEVSAPVDTMARKVKAMSLFPNVYAGKQHHRTFKKIEADPEDESHLTAKPSRRMRKEGEL